MPDPLDLKKTINLPKTKFSMKANLPVLEARWLETWEEMGLYQKIRASRKGKTRFLLHDGPPYANGHIHLGHALNKTLKDIIVKSKTMQGFDAPYVPGWDCHGLPIEIKVMAKQKAGMGKQEIRQECRKYAQNFLEIQREEFKRLGIFGDWEHPYLTMSPQYEAQTARLFGRFVDKGSVYKGFKPVHWCISCKTALAEAEVEYQDRKSPSIYVKFPLDPASPSLLPELRDRAVSALVWTTTPWTLPANLAVCFHPDYEYALVDVGEEVYIVASKRLDQVLRECGLEQRRLIGTVPGSAMEELVFRHPWLDRESKSLLADHVTLEQGTGAVHTAPGHGHEDYLVGVEHGLEVYCPVDSAGRFTPEVQHFGGQQVFQANPAINALMAQAGVLVWEGIVQHSYPHCWRCHNPVIFRATPQWFIRMDHAELRRQALEQIKQVTWIPSWGQERISNMVANRPDWCISRQRIWGVPIVAFYCAGCEEPLLSGDVVDHVSDIFEQEGADAWFVREANQLLPPGVKCGCGSSEFVKENDILDVWFDSGVSHDVVLKGRQELGWPADLYLEGGDQYRGWFHSSLLVGVAVDGAAPYRTVICHGWTLDSEGHAMSKSKGNVIAPLDVMKDNGAEILRLWVSSMDYTEDGRLGDEILSRLREAYRKIRNTHRFLLGNLFDFDPQRLVEPADLVEIDRWALARAASVSARVQEAYRDYQFHVVYHALYNFCVVDLSSFYLDVIKDRLYVSAPDSQARLSAQSALFLLADTLVRLLAPILPFTCEEIWGKLYPQGGPVESVHLAEFSRCVEDFRDEDLLQRWEKLLEIRSAVSKALEESRQGKEIGNSLQARVRIECGPECYRYLQTFSSQLRDLFIVSGVELAEGVEEDGLLVTVSRASGNKCERCWTYSPAVGTNPALPPVCSRCQATLEDMGVLT